MGLLKLLAAWAIVLSCIGHQALPAAAQTPPSSQPVLKPAKTRGSLPRAATAEETPSAGAAHKESASSCVAGWYGSSGMTQGEWRTACERASAEAGMPQVQALSLCIVAWDPATHMTRREWPGRPRTPPGTAEPPPPTPPPPP